MELLRVLPLVGLQKLASPETMQYNMRHYQRVETAATETEFITLNAGAETMSQK